MKHVRLENNKDEFYKNDLKCIFLGEIGNLNIVIGANNTRKSRFLRSLLNQDFKILIDAPKNFNEAFLKSEGLFKDISDDDSSIKLVQLQFHATHHPGEPYKNLKEFLGARAQVDFFDIEKSIKSINEILISSGSDTQFNEMHIKIRQTYYVVKLISWVYATALSEGSKFVGGPTHRRSLYEDVGYLINGSEDGKLIPDCQSKLDRLNNIMSYMEVIMDLHFEISQKSIVYIPVLRTSRMITGVSGDPFEDTIIKQHFPKLNNKVTIETGLKLYEKIGLARNGSRKQARDFTAFEKFIGEVFFQSNDLHIVAHQTAGNNDRNIKISLPDEMEDVSIQDLGDGIQGIINLLFPVFTADEGSWIFIDEPENHLHPGYQNLLMKALAENEFILKKNLRFFVNTHSNHILGGALLGSENAEIIVFNRRDANSSSIKSFEGNEYHTLEKLGVLNTSVLISNCSIWVEGVSDRFYLQSFLYAYCNHLSANNFKPVEGLNFTFIEYGGKNLIHFEFDHEFIQDEEKATNDLKNKVEAYFINSNVFLLADSDFNKKRHQVFENIERHNFKFLQTNLPEIENLLPPDILRKFLLEELKCDPIEVAKCKFDKDDIKLGALFEKHISGRKFKGDGGTLSPYYKKGLSNYVHGLILNKQIVWKDLHTSMNLKKIIVELYNFIKEKNSMG